MWIEAGERHTHTHICESNMCVSLCIPFALTCCTRAFPVQRKVDKEWKSMKTLSLYRDSNFLPWACGSFFAIPSQKKETFCVTLGWESFTSFHCPNPLYQFLGPRSYVTLRTLVLFFLGGQTVKMFLSSLFLKNPEILLSTMLSGWSWHTGKLPWGDAQLALHMVDLAPLLARHPPDRSCQWEEGHGMPNLTQRACRLGILSKRSQESLLIISYDCILWLYIISLLYIIIVSLHSLIYILVYQTFKQDIAHKYLGSNISIRYGRKKF